jgi:DNA-binding transcriptional regulator GbsR (MarR family)
MSVDTDFIEKFCIVAEQDGFPRIAGRLMGFLLLKQGPYTLDDLAEELQISKTSASTNARLLEQYGVIERVTRTGDRRDFYRLSEDHWEKMFDIAKKRMQRLHDVLEKTIESLPSTETYGRQRLREAQRFHAFIIEHLEQSIGQWRQFEPKPEE